MTPSKLALILVFLCVAGTATADKDDEKRGIRGEFKIESLNAPDPLFVTSGESVGIRVSSKSRFTLHRAVIRLNGHDVTASFVSTGSTELGGAVSGLMPGINTLEIFESRKERKASATLNVSRAQVPSLACNVASFAGTTLPVPNTVITSVTPIAATSTVPAHCLILGTIDSGRIGYESSSGAPVAAYTYAIKWAARLPDAWNSKFFMPGGGGTNGSIPNTTSNLSRGYATAANDSGHDNNVNYDPFAAGTGSFGTDYEARKNFSHRAIDVTTQTAKALIEAYYGKRPEYSYFQGCSMGGREGMMVTQYLPGYFDGVVSGDPAFKFASLTVKDVYNAQVLARLAEGMGLVSATGLPLVNNTFTNQDLQLVSKAILDACDRFDGLVDGMVGNFHQCTTRAVMPKLNALQCPDKKSPSCLLRGQIDAIQKIYGPAPARKPNGKPIYYGWMWDPGIAGCTSAEDCNTPSATNISVGWRFWKLGLFANNPAIATNTALDFTGAAGGAALTVIVPTPPVVPAPVANEGAFRIITEYDLDEYTASIFNTTQKFPVSSYEVLEVDSPNRSSFKKHGGKLIITQPQTGGPFSPLAMVEWYESLNRFEGGNGRNFEPAQEFVRLFMQPGVQHCSGGPGTSFFDVFTPIVDWVENGNAPDSILSTAPADTPWPGRTRPLCPYPTYAAYKGAGDINVASNFECHVERRRGDVGTHQGSVGNERR